MIAPPNEPPPPPFDPAAAAQRHRRAVVPLRARAAPAAVDVKVGTEASGGLFVAPKRGATQQGPMILDPSGRLVWFDPLPGNEQAFDFRTQTYSGKPVLT